MKTKRYYIIILFLTPFICSCATTSDSTIEARVSAIRSEGFIETENQHINEFWVKPGTDLSSYTKIMFRSSGIRYQEVVQKRTPPRREDNTYQIYEDERSKLASLATLELKKEIKKIKKFTVVDKAEENTLQLNLGLLDVSTFVPPDRIKVQVNRERYIGSAVITFEFRDAQTNETLMHGLDRRLVENERTFIISQAPQRWIQLRKMPAAWAEGLAAIIDSARKITSE